MIERSKSELEEGQKGLSSVVQASMSSIPRPFHLYSVHDWTHYGVSSPFLSQILYLGLCLASG